MTRQPIFDTVTILGVGLLGGSLGQALKARGMARRIRGVGRRQSSLAKALEVGAIDEVFLDSRDAAPGSDLIVVCTPAGHIIEALDVLLPLCSDKTIVTDVASTKSEVCAHARKTWPTPSRFVGSHPMAGSEKFGPEHATPDLFVGCVTMIQTSADVDANAHEAIRLLWEGVGARVIEMEPALHDAIAARTSHVPHVVASALAQLGALGIESHRDKIRALIGNGFRDVTRIAASRAEVWRDICLTNSDAVLAGLDEVISALTQIRNDVAGGDGDDIEMFFDRGRECREILLQNGSDEQDVEP